MLKLKLKLKTWRISLLKLGSQLATRWRSWAGLALMLAVIFQSVRSFDSTPRLDVVALLRKPDALRVNVPVRYVGYDIPSEFVVGYGLDYAERYRDLPFVGVLHPDVYTS